MKDVFIIAEAGVNHNGSLEIAKELILKAVDVGADAVKFQTFRADDIVTKDVQKAAYQINTTDASESQLDMLKKLELSEDDHRLLMSLSEDVGIKFLSTAFDIGSFKFLSEDLKLNTFKISSGEITNAPLLLSHGLARQKVILSTGMASLSDIETALAILAKGYTNNTDGRINLDHCYEAYFSPIGQQALKENVTLLLCTSEYPAAYESVNLKALNTLRVAFNLPVGISDHTEGLEVPIAAVAMGAKVVEKHFTLSRRMDGPDHQSSVEPAEFKRMVQSIRNIELALGSGAKTPSRAEILNRASIRKRLVSSKRILKGEVFSDENLSVKRSKDGVSAIRYWDFLGKAASRDFAAHEPIIE